MRKRHRARVIPGAVPLSVGRLPEGRSPKNCPVGRSGARLFAGSGVGQRAFFAALTSLFSWAVRFFTVVVFLVTVESEDLVVTLGAFLVVKAR